MCVHEADAAPHKPLRFDKKPHLQMRPDLNFRQFLHIPEESSSVRNIPASQLTDDYWVGEDIVDAQFSNQFSFRVSQVINPH